MNILKRVILFLCGFVVISAGIFFVGGALAGMSVYRAATDPATAAQLGQAAGMAFGMRYGEMIYGVAIVIAAGIAFRWWGAAIAIAVCVGLFYFSGHIQTPSAPQPVAQSAFGNGPRTRLAEAVTVKLSYGKISLPAGTQAEIIGENGDSVQLRLFTGQQVTVPKNKLR